MKVSASVLTSLLILTAGQPAAHAQAGPAAVTQAVHFDISDADNHNNWRMYARYEEKALTDYWWRNTTPDVIDNGRQLREIARSPAFGEAHPSCGEAALTLSHMVTGQYYSSRRLAVSGDWFKLAEVYLGQRRECLDRINVDVREYPLPGWFGR